MTSSILAFCCGSLVATLVLFVIQLWRERNDDCQKIAIRRAAYDNGLADGWKKCALAHRELQPARAEGEDGE